MIFRVYNENDSHCFSDRETMFCIRRVNPTFRFSHGSRTNNDVCLC